MSIPEGVEIKVSGNPSRPAKRRKGAVFGPILSGKRYLIHNCSFNNTLRGIVERVFVVLRDGKFQAPPSPTRRYFRELLPEFKLLTQHSPLRPCSLDHVVDLWTGSKRAVYARALESLRSKGLTREDALLTTFVKCEKIDATKDNPAPRVIQPRSPRYNLHLGRFLKPNEHEFYRRIDQMYDTDGLGDRTIFKGLNARAAAEHLVLKASRYSDPVFVGLDASRFDQHVSVEALRWEHSIYLESFAYGHGELSKLLGWQLENIGLARIPDGRRIKYRVDGRRMSGDMNTSLGNCIIMSSLVHAYCRTKRVPKFSLANNGDDCVVVCERKHLGLLSDIPSWFLEMGFNMKVEPPVYDIREVSFCQVNVLTSPEYNICVRNPNVCSSKDLHSCHPFTHHDEYRQWLIASGDCGRNSHQGVPVLQSFYNSFPRGVITNKTISSEYERWIRYSIVGGSKNVAISDEMRHSFWVAFGITPDCQIALEKMYANISYGDALGEAPHIPYVSLFQGNI